MKFQGNFASFEENIFVDFLTIFPQQKMSKLLIMLLK